MQIELTDNEIVIRLPRISQVSKSGKSLVLATTNGNKKTGVIVDDKELVVGVNAYIPRN